MAQEKTKSEDMVPQADKQGQTDIAQRAGEKGAQARVINRQQVDERNKAEERKKD
ncbi:MAG TPA: hypothetical protein VL614_10195 [Acetobacteraceae bacterium]|jgi:hypothetical protein|nr:hypothetical protein [Acetobacteraceae bacterium]